jgi:hypothetical protein
MLKWSVGFRKSFLTNKKYVFYLGKIAKGYEHCRRVMWITSALSNSGGADARVPEDDLKESNVSSGTRMSPSHSEFRNSKQASL